jgi:hypothetical protein
MTGGLPSPSWRFSGRTVSERGHSAVVIPVLARFTSDANIVAFEALAQALDDEILQPLHNIAHAAMRSRGSSSYRSDAGE